MGLVVLLCHSDDWDKAFDCIEKEGLGVAELHGHITWFEKKFTANPKHPWRVGYFRSAYNDNGTNNVLRRLGLPDLFEIFKPAELEEQYDIVKTDWDLLRERVESVAADLKALVEGGNDSAVHLMEAMNILLATADYVLGQPDPDNWRLWWCS